MENQAQQHNKRSVEPEQSNPQGADTVVPQIRAAFSPETINNESRTVEVVFGSGNPTRVRTWEHGPVMESLSFESKHVRLARLNSGAPLLDNHDRFSSVSETVLGVVERAWTDGKKGFAKVRFAKGDKSDRVLDLVRDGMIRNVSVGYGVHKYEVIRGKGKEDRGLYRAIDWEPYEISLVAVPADAAAQVRSLQNVEIQDDERDKAEQNKEQTLKRRKAQLRSLLASNPNK